MDSKLNSITINGIEYVPKGTEKQEAFEDYIIARSYAAGVFMGHLTEREGKEVVLKDARRLWAWSGAASLSQFAMEGVKNPGGCKFPIAVPEITLTEVCEIIPCTKAAVISIKAVPIWAA